MEGNRCSEPAGDRPRPEAGAGPENVPFRRLKHQAAELYEYARCYAEGKFALQAARARRGAIRIVVGAAFLLLVAAFAIACVVAVVDGLARLVGSALGDNLGWGKVVIGAGGLALIASAAWIAVAASERSSRKKAVQRYERRKQDQRQRFGRDIEAAALQAGDGRLRAPGTNRSTRPATRR